MPGSLMDTPSLEKTRPDEYKTVRLFKYYHYFYFYLSTSSLHVVSASGISISHAGTPGRELAVSFSDVS